MSCPLISHSSMNEVLLAGHSALGRQENQDTGQHHSRQWPRTSLQGLTSTSQVESTMVNRTQPSHHASNPQNKHPCESQQIRSNFETVWDGLAAARAIAFGQLVQCRDSDPVGRPGATINPRRLTQAGGRASPCQTGLIAASKGKQMRRVSWHKFNRETACRGWARKFSDATRRVRQARRPTRRA